MPFHPGIELEVNKRKTRVYLLTKITTLSPVEPDKVREYIESVEVANREVLDHGKKHIVLLWSENDTTMADWWVWGEDESEEEGAGIEVFLFRGTEQYQSPLVTAEDGLAVLASEIEK